MEPEEKRGEQRCQMNYELYMLLHTSSSAPLCPLIHPQPSNRPSVRTGLPTPNLPSRPGSTSWITRRSIIDNRRPSLPIPASQATPPSISLQVHMTLLP